MTTPHQRTQLPKLCGADIELGNFILGADYPNGSAALASRTLLAELRASPYCAHADARHHGGSGYDPQDWGRSHLTNAGVCYLDLDHFECCVPEALSAWDHVACWHAMLRIVRDVLDAANGRRSDGSRIQVLVNNSDGRGHAYGSHLNFLLTRRAWNNLFDRKMHQLLWLAAFQASSIVYTGAGKVGSENGAPPAFFQLAQRADFFETLVGEQTTHRRPIVNSRDEPLCGTAMGPRPHWPGCTASSSTTRCATAARC
jgi:proteasome accessory factor A